MFTLTCARTHTQIWFLKRNQAVGLRCELHRPLEQKQAGMPLNPHPHNWIICKDTSLQTRLSVMKVIKHSSDTTEVTLAVLKDAVWMWVLGGLLVVVVLSKTTGCFRSCHCSDVGAGRNRCFRQGDDHIYLPLSWKFKRREREKEQEREHTSPQLTCQACSVDTTLSLSHVLRRPCECDPSGSVGDCSPSDGECHCKANVEGQSCSRFVKHCWGNCAHFTHFFLSYFSMKCAYSSV